MAGPWEKYGAAPKQEQGPWAKYGAPPEAPAYDKEAALANINSPAGGLDYQPFQKTSAVQTGLGILKKLGGYAGGVADMIGSAMQNPSVAGVNMAAATGQGVASGVQATPKNAGIIEKSAMATGPLLGIDTPALANAARNRDVGGMIVEGGTPLGVAALSGPIARKAAASEIPAKIREAIPNVDDLIGTSPQRLAEIKSFPQKVESVRQTVINAEKQAHKAASDAFPKFDKPIETGKMVEVPAEGPTMIDEFGEIRPKALKPETTTFKELQEQRSNLLKNIAKEKSAVSRGATPRFDLADLYDQLRSVDDIMSRAALEQGGQAGLDQLQAARQQFGQYMQDFHNPGSPLRRVLESKQGETGKIITHLTAPDSGARTVETLRKYGANTSEIDSLLGGGERPARVAVNEAAKLRKAGSDSAYKTQRIKESLSQLQNSEMPTRAEARIPKSAKASEYPTVVGKVLKGVGVTPKSVTEMMLKRALTKKP